MGDLGQEPRLRDLLGWRGSREREWLARTWIIGEPRDQVRVQMRQGIAQRLVVHLERLIHGDDRAGDGEHLGPVARGLAVGKLGWLAHVTPPPDDDRVAALHVAALEVGIRVPALANAHAEGVRLGPPLLAHRAANTSHQVGPVSRPLTHPRHSVPSLADRRADTRLTHPHDCRVNRWGAGQGEYASKFTYGLAAEAGVLEPSGGSELTIALPKYSSTISRETPDHVPARPAARPARDRGPGAVGDQRRAGLPQRRRRGVADHRRAGRLPARAGAGHLQARRRPGEDPGRVPRPGRLRWRRPRVDPDLAEVADPDQRRRRLRRDGVDAAPVGPPGRG